jgi:hypothetical protein
LQKLQKSIISSRIWQPLSFNSKAIAPAIQSSQPLSGWATANIGIKACSLDRGNDFEMAAISELGSAGSFSP